jgi:hypothetical protein
MLMSLARFGTRFRIAMASVALLVASGCSGPTVDRVYKFGKSMYGPLVYFDKADIDRGGPSRTVRLIGDGHAVPIRADDEVRVLDTDAKTIKVEILTGKDSGSEGWIIRKEFDAHPPLAIR